MDVRRGNTGVRWVGFHHPLVFWSINLDNNYERGAVNMTKYFKIKFYIKKMFNRTAHIRHLCRKTTVLSYHRCLIKTGVEKMSNIKI